MSRSTALIALVMALELLLVAGRADSPRTASPRPTSPRGAQPTSPPPAPPHALKAGGIVDPALFADVADSPASPTADDRRLLPSESSPVPSETASTADRGIPGQESGTDEPKLSEDDIRELDRIRRQLRVSPLLGPAWQEPLGHPPTDGDFVGQLRQRYGIEDRPTRPAPTERETSDGTDRSTAHANLYKQRSLRSLGRRLDAIAQDMEELRLYDEADQIRELSHQLRAQARP